MTFNRRRALVVTAAGLLSGEAARAQDAADPTQPVRRLQAALDKARSAGPIQAAVERSFDLDAIGRQVLGERAAGATAAQLDRFREALAGAMSLELVKRLRADRPGALRITEARPLGADEWLVSSRLALDGEPPRTITWHVRGGPQGLLIHDVQSGGAGLVRGLRNEYAPALRRLGLDGLTARMEESNRRGRD